MITELQGRKVDLLKKLESLQKQKQSHLQTQVDILQGIQACCRSVAEQATNSAESSDAARTLLKRCDLTTTFGALKKQQPTLNISPQDQTIFVDLSLESVLGSINKLGVFHDFDPSKFQVSGLESQVVAGSTVEFTLTPRDNNRLHNVLAAGQGGVFVAELCKQAQDNNAIPKQAIALEQQQQPSVQEPQQLGQMIFVGKHTLPEQVFGDWILSVVAFNKHIQGSPFTITTVPPPQPPQRKEFHHKKMIQQYQVECDGTYRLTAKGARAADATWFGGSNTNRGGRGAVVSGQFVLKKGSVIDVLCASMSTACYGVCSGGGGASFVGERNGDLLLVAGGEMKLVLFVLFFGFLG